MLKKRVLSVILSVSLLFGLMTPVLAEELEIQDPASAAEEVFESASGREAELPQAPEGLFTSQNIEEGDSTDDVPAEWNIHSNPATWTTAERLDGIGVTETYLYEIIYDYSEIGSTISDSDLDDLDTFVENANNYLAGKGLDESMVYYHERGSYVQINSPNNEELVFDFLLTLNNLSIESKLTSYGFDPDDPEQKIQNYTEPEESTEWSVYSPFSYFFNGPEETRVYNGNVYPAPGGKDANPYFRWFYRAVDVGKDGLYVLVQYGTEEEPGERYFEKRSDGTTEVNTRYHGEDGDEPVVTYCGLKHNYSKDGKGFTLDFNIDVALVKYDEAAKTTSIVKGLDIKKVNFRNNLNATLPARYLDESGKQKAKLTTAENKNLKGQPSFTIVPNCRADAKPYKKEIAAALKKTPFNFEIRQMDIGDTEAFLIGNTEDYSEEYDEEGNLIEDPWSLGAIYSFNIAKEDDPVVKQEEAQAAFVAKYLPYMKNINDYGDLSDELIKDEIASYNILIPDGGAYETNEDGSYTGRICFYKVPLYVDPEIDSLAVKQKKIRQVYVNLNAENEKGRTQLSFNAKGEAKLKLYLARTQIITKEEKGRYADSPDGFLWIYREKEIYHKLKTSKKAGGKQDVFFRSGKLADESPYVILTGQNDLCGTTIMRLITDRWGNEEIRVGHYVDDSHFYIESEDGEAD